MGTGGMVPVGAESQFRQCLIWEIDVHLFSSRVRNCQGRMIFVIAMRMHTDQPPEVPLRLNQEGH
jgi:hypothetical protein